MIKKILCAVAVALPMLAAAQSVKVGLVDINAVIAALPETTEAQTKLQETSQKLDEEYTKLGEEMKRKYDEFNALPEDEPQAIRERKARELQDYQSKIQQFEQSAMQNIQDMQQQLMAPIIQKVRTAINAVGQEGGFTLVQNLDPQIVFYYQEPAADITKEVMAKLGVQ